MNIADLYARFLEAGKVSTDTRQIVPGSMFFALKGDRFNANEFAREALEKGARFAVVDDSRYAQAGDDRFVLVDDVLRTLQQLARWHRDQLTIPVLGLTGSNGKTTTKELIKNVLGASYRVFATSGNLNNHIGVPLSVLSIDASVEIAVIEMGANRVGDIDLLCQIAHPSHGLITNIGKAHIGTFGGFENIKRGKGELYDHLFKNNGIVFVNSQNPILSAMTTRFASPVTYPAAGDYYHADMLEVNPYVKFRAENGDEMQTQLMGAYNFENIATALCVGKFFGVDPRAANLAAAAYVPSNMRSQVIRKGTNTIILDAYNANPSSMQAAIENLAQLKAGRKVLILGDMFELEEESEREHRQLGALIKERNLSEVYLCGNHIAAAREMLPQAIHFHTRDELINELSHTMITNATILVKASRGIGLEAVVEHL